MHTQRPADTTDLDHPTAQTTSLLDALDQEWAWLLASGHADAALQRWSTDEPALAGLSAEEVVDSIQHQDGAGRARSDELLLTLLRLARHDRQAQRFVLQLFLPLCRTLATWTRPATMSAEEWLGHVLCAMCETIATYPVERRPARVAGNLAWDTRHRLLQTLTRHRQQHRCERPLRNPTTDLGTLTHVPDATEAVEAAWMLTWATRRARIPEHTTRLLVLARAAGIPTSELADGEGTPRPRLRQRLSRAETRLQHLLAPANTSAPDG